jgi:hypothetical protein
MTFVDEFNRPLPAGSALKDPRNLHQGIVGYDSQTGQQVMLHKPFRIGRPVITEPSAFADGKCRLVRTRVPKSPAEAEAVLQRAVAQVQRPTPWSVFDNCEDFVSRAYTGHSGSATRNLVLGVLAVVCIGAVVSS